MDTIDFSLCENLVLTNWSDDAGDLWVAVAAGASKSFDGAMPEESLLVFVRMC